MGVLNKQIVPQMTHFSVIPGYTDASDASTLVPFITKLWRISVSIVTAERLGIEVGYEVGRIVGE